MPVNFTEHDTVITAFAEPAKGPGWTNMPIWVIIREQNTGKLRMECIQPSEQTPGMDALYMCSTAAHRSMTGHVSAALKKALNDADKVVPAQPGN